MEETKGNVKVMIRKITTSKSSLLVLLRRHLRLRLLNLQPRQSTPKDAVGEVDEDGVAGVAAVSAARDGFRTHLRTPSEVGHYPLPVRLHRHCCSLGTRD